MRMNDRTTPPLAGTDPPVRPEPCPLGIMGKRRLLASLSISDTSPADAGKTTRSGIVPSVLPS